MKEWKLGDGSEGWLETVMAHKERNRIIDIGTLAEGISKRMTDEEHEAYPEIMDSLVALIKASEDKNPLYQHD